MYSDHSLARPIELPCGIVLKNRIAKSAMSDVLGDGVGGVTEEQVVLYERWARGGLALSLIGEVQSSPAMPEDPGNLVLDQSAHVEGFERLASQGRKNGAALWLQLGNAGALADRAVAEAFGPSAVRVGALQCRELSLDDIRALPDQYARSARLARSAGFSGVQIHAGHGFLINQFLSPLFNRRKDRYGGIIRHRSRLLIEILEAVRGAVGAGYPIGVKLNSTDLIEGGLDEADAIEVVKLLTRSRTDLIEISGGTYVPGVKPKPRPSRNGPYFLEFSKAARAMSEVPIMLTGGVKTRAEACAAMEQKACDIVGVARLVALDPGLATKWLDTNSTHPDPPFPKLDTTGGGDVTAWYQRRLRDIAQRDERTIDWAADEAQADLSARHAANANRWNAAFNGGGLNTN